MLISTLKSIFSKLLRVFMSRRSNGFYLKNNVDIIQCTTCISLVFVQQVQQEFVEFAPERKQLSSTVEYIYYNDAVRRRRGTLLAR